MQEDNSKEIFKHSSNKVVNNLLCTVSNCYSPSYPLPQDRSGHSAFICLCLFWPDVLVRSTVGWSNQWYLNHNISFDISQPSLLMPENSFFLFSIEDKTT